jgi:hypothetical protein
MTEKEMKKVEQEIKEIKKGETEIKQDMDKSMKQIKIFIIVLLIAIAALVLLFIFKENIKDAYSKMAGDEIVYNNITFTKGTVGKIIMYSANLLVKRTDGIKTYTFYLRNNPNELVKKVDSKVGRILQKNVYIALSPEISDCNMTSLATWELASFLSTLQYNVTGAATDRSALRNNETDVPIVNCGDSLNETSVIIFQQGNETVVTMHENYIRCFIVQAKDCEIVAASERMILEILDQKLGILGD